MPRPERQPREAALDDAVADHRRHVGPRRLRRRDDEPGVDVDDGDLEDGTIDRLVGSIDRAHDERVTGCEHRRRTPGRVDQIDRRIADLAGAAAMALQRVRLIRERLEIHLVHIALGDVAGRSDRAHASLRHPHNLTAQPPHVPHVVRDEQDGLPFGDQAAQRLERAAAERGIADGEHFIDEHDVGTGEDGDGEAKPSVESGRIALHRRVDQPLDIGELHDGVELPIDLAPRQTEQAGAEVDVLAPRELRVEARAELDQRHDVSGHAHRAARRPRHA